jgi:hypothetical protein
MVNGPDGGDTDVRVTYREGWDAQRQALTGVFGRGVAADRDAAGEQYAVAFTLPGREMPTAMLHVAWAHHYLGIWGCAGGQLGRAHVLGWSLVNETKADHCADAKVSLGPCASFESRTCTVPMGAATSTQSPPPLPL